MQQTLALRIAAMSILSRSRTCKRNFSQHSLHRKSLVHSFSHIFHMVISMEKKAHVMTSIASQILLQLCIFAHTIICFPRPIYNARLLYASTERVHICVMRRLLPSLFERISYFKNYSTQRSQCIEFLCVR